MTRVDGTTQVFAVVGDPVAHSLSPAMFNAAFSALGLNAVYVAIRTTTTGLPHVLRGFASGNIAGNVTVPHKVAVASLIVRLTDIAKELQAVNTFWPDGERLMGDNTDVAGIKDALDRLDATPPWLILGTGGSARAAVAAAKVAGVPAIVHSRDQGRAQEFAEWGRALGASLHADDGREAGTVINATPLGLTKDDKLPMAMDRLAGCSAALDLVYARGGTNFTNVCRQAGMRASDGRTVLVGQGLEAFRRFFPNVEPPTEIMTAAVDRALR